jgi:hypothetical protein
MFNHDPFEDYLDYIPTKQLALADIFRDATAVIDALGWDPDITTHTTSIQVPIPAGHIHQLHIRRSDLLDTHLDLLEDIGTDAEALELIMADIHAQPPQRRSPQPRLRRLHQHDHDVAHRTSV